MYTTGLVDQWKTIHSLLTIQHPIVDIKEPGAVWRGRGGGPEKGEGEGKPRQVGS